VIEGPSLLARDHRPGSIGLSDTPLEQLGVIYVVHVALGEQRGALQLQFLLAGRRDPYRDSGNANGDDHPASRSSRASFMDRRSSGAPAPRKKRTISCREREEIPKFRGSERGQTKIHFLGRAVSPPREEDILWDPFEVDGQTGFSFEPRYLEKPPID